MAGTIAIEWKGPGGHYADFRRDALDWTRTPVAGETVSFPSTARITDRDVYRVDSVHWSATGDPHILLEAIEDADGVDLEAEWSKRSKLLAAGFTTEDESSGLDV